MKNAGPVTIREKKLQDGRISLYLDIYTKGKRTYEFLKLYLVPAKTKQERDQNKQTRTTGVFVTLVLLCCGSGWGILLIL